MASSWKNFERLVANLIGSERTPLSGQNSKHTRSDTLHSELFIECKKRKEWAIFNLYRDTEEKAKKENKIPILALKENGRHGFLFVIKAKDLDSLYDAMRKDN